MGSVPDPTYHTIVIPLQTRFVLFVFDDIGALLGLTDWHSTSVDVHADVLK